MRAPGRLLRAARCLREEFFVVGTRTGVDARGTHADYHLLRLEGYLDIGRYPEIRAAFEAVPSGPVLIDLQDVVGVDSVFLSEMLLFKRRRRPDRVVVVIPPRGHLAQIFSIANIGQKLDVFPDLSTAIAALGVPSLAQPREGTETPAD